MSGRQKNSTNLSVSSWRDNEKSAWVALWKQLSDLLGDEERRIIEERNDKKKLSEQGRSECVPQEKSAISLLKDQLTFSKNTILQREQAELAEEAVRRFLLMIESLKHEGLVIRNVEGHKEVKIMARGEQGGARLVTMTEETRLLYGAPNHTFFEAAERATFAAKKAGKISQTRSVEMEKLRKMKEKAGTREEQEITNGAAQDAAAEDERRGRAALAEQQSREEDASSVTSLSAASTTANEKESKFKDEYFTLETMLKDYRIHLDEWAKKRGYKFDRSQNDSQHMPAYVLHKMTDQRSQKMRDLTAPEQQDCLAKLHATNALLRLLAFPNFVGHSESKTHEEMIKAFFSSEETKKHFAILRQRRREDSVLTGLLRGIDGLMTRIGLGRFTPIGVDGRVLANRVHHFTRRLGINYTEIDKAGSAHSKNKQRITKEHR
jgi:hypothetical protein